MLADFVAGIVAGRFAGGVVRVRAGILACIRAPGGVVFLAAATAGAVAAGVVDDMVGESFRW